MQTTLLTLAIAVILALLAALLGPHFVDWNAQRGNFERQASALIGLPVRVAGKMDVRLLPSPSLVLSDIEIGKPGDAQALRAKALGIEFALPALAERQAARGRTARDRAGTRAVARPRRPRDAAAGFGRHEYRGAVDRQAA